jgi:hypothetical protein
VAQCLLHALHLLLTLQALPMLTPNIASNCVEYTLEAIITRNFALLFQLEKVSDGQSFDGSESPSTLTKQ